MCVGVLMCTREIGQFLLQCIHPTPAVTTYVRNERGDSLICNNFMMILYSWIFERARSQQLLERDLKSLLAEGSTRFRVVKYGNIIKWFVLFKENVVHLCVHLFNLFDYEGFCVCVCSFTIDENKDTWFSRQDKSLDGCTWEIKPFAYCIFRAAPSLDLTFFNPAGMHGDQIAVKIRRSGSLSQAKQTHGLGDRQRRRVLGVPWPLSKAVMGPTWAFCSPEAVGVIICQGARVGVCVSGRACFRARVCDVRVGL